MQIMCERGIEAQAKIAVAAEACERRDGWKRQNGAEAAGKLHLLLVPIWKVYGGGHDPGDPGDTPQTIFRTLAHAAGTAANRFLLVSHHTSTGSSDPDAS